VYRGSFDRKLNPIDDCFSLVFTSRTRMVGSAFRNAFGTETDEINQSFCMPGYTSVGLLSK
jgi:hypothetical protein